MSGYDRERVEDIVAGTLRKLTALDEPEDMTAAETATDIAAGFLPGVGTAQAMRDFERARRKGDKLGMALAAASGVPVAGGVVKPVAKIAKSPIDRAVAKVRDIRELGEPSFNIPQPKLKSRFAGYHVTQDLPAVLESGQLTNKGVGAANMQGYAPTHVGGAYFYSDPKLAAAQRERVIENIFGDGTVSTEEYPILKMLLNDQMRLAPDEDVGLNLPWYKSYKEGSFAKLDPTGLERLLKIYSGDPETTKDIVRDTLKSKGYANGGPVLPADRATGYRAPGQRPDDRAARFGTSYLKSLPGAAKGVATGYVDMLSALNTYLYQLEPAEQIALLKQLPAGLRDMMLRGVESVKQLPAKVAAATPESAGQFGAQLTAEIALDPFRGVGKAAPTTQVIKPKGGNWPKDAVEPVVNRYKTPKRVPALTMGDELRIDPELLMRPEQLVENYQKELDKIDLDDPRNQDKAYQLQQEIEGETRNAALDNWLEQKLTKYVKSELASPDDPIRKQIDEFAGKKKQLLEQKDQQISKAMLDLEKARAERGFTPEMLTRSQARIRELRREREYIEKQSGAHVPPRPLELADQWVPESVPDMRERMGYEVQGIGETPLGKGWENMADLSIRPTMAGDILNRRVYSMIENNPWLTKVPPETRVYQVNPTSFRELHFGHLKDELRNALDPASDLPDALKIEPDKLQKLNIAQASKLVDEINAFRATRQSEVNAARAANIATAPVKEYPEQGLKWVELKMPDELPEGYEPGKPTALGEPTYRQTGTKDDKLKDPRRAALEDALKYEGEILKHCVGGYCEDVVQGRSRIFSLRDYDGRPRVTIEVKPGESPSKLAHMLPLDKFNPLVMEVRDRYFDGRMPQDPAGQKKMDELIGQEYVKEYGPPPLNIVQVKGAENMKPQPEDIPFVQDFIRSSGYKIAGDFENTDLIQLGDQYITQEEFGPMRENALRFLSEHPLFESARRANADYDNFSGDIPSPEYSAVDRARGAPVAPDIPYTWRELFSILNDPKAWRPDDVSAALTHAREIARRAGIENFAKGGKVGYNPAVVDGIVNRIREKLNG